MPGIKVEDDDGLPAGSVTPQHQATPPPQIPLWLHLERGGGSSPAAAEPECPVVADLSSASADSGEEPQHPPLVGPQSCRCPAPSLLVTTADPRRRDPKPRRTSLNDVPKWYRRPGGRVVPLRFIDSPSDAHHRHDRHGRWKYGKLVLLLHGLDPARLGENDDLAEVYWARRKKGGAAPKAALVKSCEGAEGAESGGTEVYLEPVAPSGEGEAPSLQLVYASGNAAAECYDCARAEEEEVERERQRERERQQRERERERDREREQQRAEEHERERERVRAGVSIGGGGGDGGGARLGGRSSPGGGGGASLAPKPDPAVVPKLDPASALLPAAASSIVGNNILSRLLDRHNRWPFGGLAELLHNSADADATRVNISAFPSPSDFFDPFQPNFALEISDDGKGMDHADMVRMMRIGADESIGRADKVGKIGGYGVGFKAGALATAHTAVVLSSCLEKRTVSVGLLSNEPYEERQERPHVGLVATQSMDTAMVDEATTTVEGRDMILDLIKNINPCLTRERIALWSGQMHGKSGTTVFLCGVRRNPDLPGRMIYEFAKDGECAGDDIGPWVMGNDKPDLVFLNPGLDRETFDEFPGRYDGQKAPMDSSFRAYLSLMFKSRKPKITLFGEDVEQHDLSQELDDKAIVDLDFGVKADVGRHKPSEKLGLSGAMLYCEDVLVSSYARQEFEIPPDERKLGVLLVVDLPKSTSESRTVHDQGFKPKDNKLSFDWAGKKPFRRKLKAEFLRYEDWADAERDRKNPLRTALRSVVSQVTDELERRYGPNSSGSMVGVLKLPLQEDACARGPDKKATHTSYFRSISDPISLRELSERIELEKYKGDGDGDGNGLAAFREDLERIFRNVQYWHSKCRWHPDNEVDDLALLSNAEDGHDETIPFHVTGKVYTIKAICTHLKIPKAFRRAIVEGNSEYGNITSKTEFEVGTTILLPHHLDRTAYKDAEEILTFALKRLDDAERTLKRVERAKASGARDCWIQCERRGCGKWRRVAEEYARRFERTDMAWTCDAAEGSPVEGCHVPQDPGYDPSMMVEVRASSSSAEETVRPSSTAAAMASKAFGAGSSSSTSISSRGSSKKRSRASGGGSGGRGTKPDRGTKRPGSVQKKKRSHWG